VTWAGGKSGCFGRMGLRKDLSKYAKLLGRSALTLEGEFLKKLNVICVQTQFGAIL
jgi:hypothetical protein